MHSSHRWSNFNSRDGYPFFFVKFQRIQKPRTKVREEWPMSTFQLRVVSPQGDWPTSLIGAGHEPAHQVFTTRPLPQGSEQEPKKHMWSSWLHYDLTCCSQKCSSELRGKQAGRGSANPRLWFSAGKASNQFNVVTRERVDGMQRSWLSGQSTFWLPPMVMSFGSWPWMYDKNWIPDSQYSNTAIAACCQHKNMDHNKSFYCIIWSYRLSF